MKIYFERFEDISSENKQNVLLGYIENKIVVLIRKLKDKEDRKYYIEKHLRINSNIKLITMLE